ncbi:MAG: ABC transporter transmembrane domain-containing protein [Desulfocapsaceae bacterium]
MRLTERPLFYWIKKRYRALQIVLLVIIVIGLFFRVYPLEMQRKIINIAINLRMVDKLYLYCGLYLGAVLMAGIMKYAANTLQAIIGQKILIGMRRELYQHILHLPLTFFHRTQTGTITSAMTAELNAIATFLGGALAIPITSVLTFLVFLGFMIYLNPLLGLLSMIIYPFEFTVIPLLQRWHNRYNQKRVMVTRRMAGLVNEAAEGIHEVQGNGSYLLEQMKLDRLIYRLYDLIVRLDILKYGIKFSNNLFQSIGPFLLFLVGGFMAINGEFTIGALVAFLSAYEKVYDPWKELILYYQSYQDAQVRYKQIMELFDHKPQFLLEAPVSEPRSFKGSIEAKNIGYQINQSIQLLDDISFRLEAGKHLALVGFSGSGKSTLSHVLSRLYHQSSGTLSIDGQMIETMSQRDVVTGISTVAQHSFIFTGSVRDNLLYSTNALHLAGGNHELPNRQEIFEIVTEVGLAPDLIRWGLRSTISPLRAEPMISSFIKMREIVRRKMGTDISQAVEFYDVNRFLQYSPVAVNIMFGTYGIAYTTKKLLTHETFRTFIDDEALEEPLIEFGIEIAEATINLLGEFSEDDFLFQGSPMKPDQLKDYENLIEHIHLGRSWKNLNKKSRDRLLLLGLKFTPGLHKITSLPGSLESAIMEARPRFLEQVANIDIESCSNGTNGTLQTEIASLDQKHKAGPAKTDFTPFCINHYLYSRNLEDNIIFGTVIDRDLVREKLSVVAAEELKRHGLLEYIMDIGLDFHVGSKGDNLSGGQKQKLALARALLKKSPVLILDEATASLDNNSQTRIQRYISDKLKGNTTVIAVVHRLDMISEYDHILVMKEGKIVESGSYDDLIEKKGTLYELINGSRE